MKPALAVARAQQYLEPTPTRRFVLYMQQYVLIHRMAPGPEVNSEGSGRTEPLLPHTLLTGLHRWASQVFVRFLAHWRCEDSSAFLCKGGF